MGYGGSTIGIPFGISGFNHSPNVDGKPFSSLVEPSRNFNLNQDGVRWRGGTTKLFGTPVSGTPRIMGLHDFRKTDGTIFEVFATIAGEVFKNSTTTIKTGMSTTNKFWFETFQNTLSIADGFSRPQTWDGIAASTSDITSIPTDWTGTNFPDQIIRHGRGLDESLWAKGVVSQKQRIYVSKSRDGNDFSDGEVFLLDIDSGDDKGVVALFSFGERIFALGRRRAFVVDDSSLTRTEWGHFKAQWEGGVAHHRLVAFPPNDVHLMSEDGDIYSVAASDQFGDYVRASLVKPAFIDRWIRQNVNLDKIDDFHSVYDPTLRAVKWFIVRNGQTEVDTALVYFVDRPPEIAWAIHENQNVVSGYSASVSAIVKEATGVIRLHTGDYNGDLWKLEQANTNDDDEAYVKRMRTPDNHLGDPRLTKHFKRAIMVAQPEGAFDVTVRNFIDGVEGVPETVTLGVTGSVYGTGMYGTAIFGGDQVSDTFFEVGDVGKRLGIEISNNVKNEDFFISQLLLDFKPLGARPQ